MDDKITRLKELLGQVVALQQTQAVLWWDRETQMPQGGAADRGNQLVFLARLEHDSFTSDEIGDLLHDLASTSSDLDPDSDEARLVKVIKRDYDRECKLPPELVEELSRASSEAVPVWQRARQNSDFKAFVPYLKRNMEVTRKLAEAYGYKKRPYEAFTEIIEPGVSLEQLETIFAELKGAILPLLEKIKEHQDAVDDSLLHQQYDTKEQLSFSLKLAEQYGYDLSRGRMDLSAHPFCQSMGLGDVRITTRVLPDFLSACLFAVLHESGHAMYEQGVGSNLVGTPLAHGASAGVHESQSRLWENLVGRSRPYQDYLFPRLQQTFPQQLGNVDKEAFYRAINKVYPSLIRVEADEVTYNLHILLRFELENEMLEGRVDIDNLDEVWSDRMGKYLGIRPTNPAEGVLQDIHWAWGGVYIFPSYTLGNVISTQLFAQARKDIADLDGHIAHGEFGELLAWLQSNIYRHGRKFEANELTQRITGQPVNTGAWIEYVNTKFPAIYGF